LIRHYPLPGEDRRRLKVQEGQALSEKSQMVSGAVIRRGIPGGDDASAAAVGAGCHRFRSEEPEPENHEHQLER
jgi:hypothetical protein